MNLRVEETSAAIDWTARYTWKMCVDVFVRPKTVATQTVGCGPVPGRVGSVPGPRRCKTVILKFEIIN